tara:strand:- start:1120 stop:2043 length:924 start_codon:yes stop_codon:yes gene_type:complete
MIKYIFFGLTNRFKYFKLLLFSFLISDKRYIENRFYKSFGRKIDFKAVNTFNEKLQWLKLYDRKKVHQDLVDKFKVRSYVSKIIGEEYLNTIFGVYYDFESFDRDYPNLPDRFIIKASHASGWNYFVDKSTVKKDIMNKTIKRWFRQNFYYYGREWVYKNVKKSVIVEEIIEPINPAHVVPRDYRFFCFNGEPKFIALDIGTYISKNVNDNGELISKRERNIYDLAWNKINVKIKHPLIDENISKPKKINEMILLSNKLSKNLKFARIDFYCEEKVIFGEITFFPGNAFQKITPDKFDLKFGQYLDI